jgi:type I restriction enzyme S subunit
MQNQIKGNEGAVFSSINKRQIESISIPLPPLPKQERIVAILDEASAAIATATANAEKNLANARELFESACASIFSNAENEDWTSTTVEAVAKDKKGTMRTGPFGSQLLHSEFVEEGVVVLGIDNAVQNEFAWDQRRFITEEKFAELSRFEAFPGDVVITIMGTCGRCAVLPEHLPRAITSKHLCCITTDKSKCLPEYLHHYFLHHPLSLDYLEKNAKGAIMAGLNMTIIKGLPIKFPSIEEQVELVRRFDSMSNHYKLLKKVLKAKQECYTELRQSILHKAFTGELTADKKAADRTLVEAGL